MRTLLITIDALRKDHLGYFGYERNTTPFLDKLAEENTVFKNCWSASCHTRESIPSILSGEKPENCISGYYRLDSSTIAEKLPEEVETSAVTTGCYLTRTENYDRGFDSFISDYFLGGNLVTRQLEYFGRVAADKQHLSAEDQKDEIISSLENQQSFVWAHFMDVHAPYNKHSENYFGSEVSRRKLQYLFRKANHTPSLMTKEDRKKLIDAYDNSMRDLDQQIKEIVSEIPEETEVIIVGDHGELLGEKNRYKHPRKLVDELIQVPLIIVNEKDRDVQRSVSTLDIAPTIAEKHGVNIEADGQSLYSDDSRVVEASCFRYGSRMKREIK